MTCRDLPFSGLASAAFALALIAGCSGDDSASGSESDSATATATDSSTTNGSAGSNSDTATTSTSDPSGTGTDSATSDSTSTTTTDGTSTTVNPTTGESEVTSDSGTTTTGTTGLTATDTDPPPDCVEDADCPDGQLCVDQVCVDKPECVEDADCGADQYCNAGMCVDKCKPGDGMMMGMVEQSYIWVPSQNDGTVSKVDTLTLTEVARYRTGPSGGTESGSRTAVSADGRFVVVNGRGTGRSTAVAANQDDCVDLNNDGIIQTSANKDDILPWGQDECVVWSLVYPEWGGAHQNGPRGVTWTLGEWNDDPNVCAYENPKVWVGYRSKTAGTAHLARLNGLTGQIEEIVPVANWVGQSSFAPYGAALSPDQKPWFSALRGEIVRVNTDQDPITVDRFTPPGNVQSYGFTVGPNGNPWMAGCSGPVTMFDVENQQWIAVPGTSACHRGIAIDKENHVWVASNGPCGLVEIDGNTQTLINKHTLPQCSTAIGPSIDVEGHLWLVDQGGWAWKIKDNNVPGAEQVIIPGSHYVYSDMTGGQVAFAIPQ